MIGDIQQPLRLGANLANRKGPAGVTNPALVAHANIHADNVASAQDVFAAGDAVTDHLVDRYANGCRKRRGRWSAMLRRACPVAFVHRDGVLTADVILSDAIKFGG